MDLTTLLAYFGAGLFLVNAIPHTVSGVQGRPFQSPFARPPGKGQSSAVINALWGFFNLVAGFWLLFRVGHFNVHNNEHVLALAAGALVSAVGLAQWFGWQNGGNAPADAAKRR